MQSQIHQILFTNSIYDKVINKKQAQKQFSFSNKGEMTYGL